ncbi:MAG: hypothetical protein EOP45_22870 [Sphingobacteriaceae bacterium]|nr:MAG: hypothetical protein EOP45_22870 [Sphingobacteriaceae bacterium]
MYDRWTRMRNLLKSQGFRSSDPLYDDFRVRFELISNLFNELRGTKINFIDYNFVARQILSGLGDDQFVDRFPQHALSDQEMNIWHNILERLDSSVEASDDGSA